MGVTHHPVNLAQGIRVIAGIYHVQNVNAYDSRLKTWMNRLHGVATCHLANCASAGEDWSNAGITLRSPAMSCSPLWRWDRFNS